MPPPHTCFCGDRAGWGKLFLCLPLSLPKCSPCKSCPACPEQAGATLKFPLLLDNQESCNDDLGKGREGDMPQSPEGKMGDLYCSGDFKWSPEAPVVWFA